MRIKMSDADVYNKIKELLDLLENVQVYMRDLCTIPERLCQEIDDILAKGKG